MVHEMERATRVPPRVERPKSATAPSVLRLKTLSERVEPQDPEVLLAQMLSKYGHMALQQEFPVEVGAYIKANPSELSFVEDVCKKIEQSKSGGYSLNYDDIRLIHKYGLRNLRGVTLGGGTDVLGDKRLVGFNLDGAHFSDTCLYNVDCSGTSFRDLRLNQSMNWFKKCLLHTSAFSNININGRTIGLLEKSICIPGSNWNIHKTELQEVGVCSDCERWNADILGLNGDLYKNRGILLFDHDIPLGYMKLKGEKTFIALRTVYNEQGEAMFWKGMVYCLEHHIVQRLQEMSKKAQHHSEWRKVNVEDLLRYESSSDATDQNVEAYDKLARINMRFIRDPGVFDAITALADDLDAKRIPLVNIQNMKLENVDAIGLRQRVADSMGRLRRKLLSRWRNWNEV